MKVREKKMIEAAAILKTPLFDLFPMNAVSETSLKTNES